jgi:hypothetical protein
MIELLLLVGLGLAVVIAGMAAVLGVVLFFVKLLLLLVLLPLRLLLFPVRLAVRLVIGLLALPFILLGLVLGAGGLVVAGVVGLIGPMLPVLFLGLIVWLIVKASKPVVPAPPAVR